MQIVCLPSKAHIYFLILVLNSVNVNDCLMSFDRLFQSRMVLGKYDFENISFLINKSY